MRRTNSLGSGNGCCPCHTCTVTISVQLCTVCPAGTYSTMLALPWRERCPTIHPSGGLANRNSPWGRVAIPCARAPAGLERSARRARTTQARGPASLIGVPGSRGSNPDRAPGPVGLAEHALEELARRIAREVLVEGDLARNLVVGDMATGEGGDVLGGEPGPRLELHGGVDPLAPVVVGHAEDRHVLDVRMAVQGVLDLGGIDV